MTEILQKNGIFEITIGGKAYAKIVPVEGAVDTFEKNRGRCLEVAPSHRKGCRSYENGDRSLR